MMSVPARVILDEEERYDNLHHALRTRELIGQAQGILMERERITGDRAFDISAGPHSTSTSDQRHRPHPHRNARHAPPDAANLDRAPRTGSESSTKGRTTPAGAGHTATNLYGWVTEDAELAALDWRRLASGWKEGGDA